MLLLSELLESESESELVSETDTFVLVTVLSLVPNTLLIATDGIWVVVVVGTTIGTNVVVRTNFGVDVWNIGCGVVVDCLDTTTVLLTLETETSSSSSSLSGGNVGSEMLTLRPPLPVRELVLPSTLLVLSSSSSSSALLLAVLPPPPAPAPPRPPIPLLSRTGPTVRKITGNNNWTFCWMDCSICYLR